MAMTPREARTVNFTEDRRGYAPTEVHEYQERVAEALRLYETEVGRLRARLEDSEERIKELQDAEDAVRRTFVAASQTKREMVAEAESEAARVRREADEAAARLRAAAEEHTSQQRAAAQAEATRLVQEARTEAHETRAKAETEVRLLERRLLQLRGSITDLEERLRDFAGRALDELSVAGGMIDLETAELGDIESLVPETAPAARAAEPATDAAATAHAEAGQEPEPDEPAPSEVETEVTVVEVETEVTKVAIEAVQTEPDVSAPEVRAPAGAPAVAAAVESGPPGPAVGVPVRPSGDPGVERPDDDDPDSGFYERRLAGLRRRIESASDD